MEQDFPTIILKTPKENTNIIKYEGKWCKNVGSNIVQKLETNFLDNELPTLTPTYFDSFAEAMMTKNEREQYYQEINYSEDFSVVTPSHTTIFHIPIFYSLFQNTYFPLYLCGYNNVLKHIVTLKRNISELYQIQAIYQDGSRENIPVSRKTVESIGNIKYTKDNEKDILLLPLPKLKGEYFNFTPEEYGYMINNRPKSYFFNDIKYFQTKESKKFGEILSLDIPKDFFPHTYIWVAKNQKGFSNYQAGNYSPSSETTITLSDDTSKTLNYLETQRRHPYKHFSSQPSQPGFNYWTNGMRARDNFPIPEIAISKIDLKLEDINPYTKITHDLNQLSNDDTFLLEALLIYTKKITFESFPKTEEERKTISSKVNISF